MNIVGECDWCGEAILEGDKVVEKEWYSTVTGKYYTFTYHLYKCSEEDY